MNDNDARIYAAVAELAAEHGGVDASRITPESHFVNDLNFDSLMMVEFVMAVEDRFRLTVPDDAAQQLHTVGQVVDWIAKQSSPEAEPVDAI